MKDLAKKNVLTWLLRSIYLQLYISLIASPILLYWGLPLSVASPLGNILFNPLLTLFLFLSSLLFFAELLHLPSSAIAWSLNQCTWLFDALARWGKQYWLIGFARPSLLVLWLIPMATFGIIHYRRAQRSILGIALLAGLSSLTSIYLIYAQRPKTIQTIACNKGFLTIVHMRNKTIVIDPGVLGSRISAPSFIQYSLIPTIIKSSGTMSIDLLILAKCNQTTLTAVEKLAELMTIKSIYFPASCPVSNPEAQRQEDVEHTKLQALAPCYAMIGPLEVIIPGGSMTITPCRRSFIYKGLRYPFIEIDGSINGETFIIKTDHKK